MILVTGGTGLLGSRVVYDLLKCGEKVKVLRRRNSSSKLIEKWIGNDLHLMNSIIWVEGDLLDHSILDDLVSDIEGVYHCAAMVSFSSSDQAMMSKINIDGTENLVNACLNYSNIKFFCHVSSVATLGRVTSGEVLNEDSHWIAGKHNSNYSISKYGAEREVWRAYAEGLPCVIVNPSIILGPGKWDIGSTALFGKVKKGLKFYTSGSSGFVDVRDVSKAMLFVVEKQFFGERFILDGGTLSYKDLFEKIATNFNVSPPFILAPHWLANIVWRIEKIKAIILRRSPLITKETTYSAYQNRYYSTNKIKQKDFAFRSLDETIRFTCSQYQ